MSKYIHVTEFRNEACWDVLKRGPYVNMSKFSSLINIDDIIKVEDCENDSENGSYCRIYLDKRKYGDNNIINVLDRYSVLSGLIIKNQ